MQHNLERTLEGKVALDPTLLDNKKASILVNILIKIQIPSIKQCHLEGVQLEFGPIIVIETRVAILDKVHV